MRFCVLGHKSVSITKRKVGQTKKNERRQLYKESVLLTSEKCARRQYQEQKFYLFKKNNYAQIYVSEYYFLHFGRRKDSSLLPFPGYAYEWNN